MLLLGHRNDEKTWQDHLGLALAESASGDSKLNILVLAGAKISRAVPLSVVSGGVKCSHLKAGAITVGLNSIMAMALWLEAWWMRCMISLLRRRGGPVS